MDQSRETSPTETAGGVVAIRNANGRAGFIITCTAFLLAIFRSSCIVRAGELKFFVVTGQGEVIFVANLLRVGYERIERTIALILPDALLMMEENLIKNIFIERGLYVAESKLVLPSHRRIRDILPNADGRWGSKTGRIAVRGLRRLGKDPMTVYGTADWREIAHKIVENIREYYMSGPILGLVLQGANAIEVAHAIAGGTSPRSADVHTIRYRLSPDDYDFANGKGRPCMKRIHTASNKWEARRQLRWLIKIPSYQGPMIFAKELYQWLLDSGAKIPLGGPELT